MLGLLAALVDIDRILAIECVYAYGSDPNESYNLAAESKHATTVQELAEMLERGWRSALPALAEKTE